ncbi:MAG: type II toxin-antitoxin system VapC family toxin [Bacteroidota bacterium]
MMDRVFVDTDIVLDLLMARPPHYVYAADLFSYSDLGHLDIFVSVLTFSNVNYILSRQFSALQARRILFKFKALVGVLPVTDKTIQSALASDFSDVEDAIQYFSAVENGLDILLTRNLKDYRKAEITILTAQEFLKSRG